jgi:two-component system, NarL family, sensor kinase
MNQWIWGLIGGLFVGIFALDISTHSDYVIGYLYIIPILLSANPKFSFNITFQLVVLAVILVSIAIWIPKAYLIQAPIVINRLIVVTALVVTSILSDRHHNTQKTLLQQKAKLQTQDRMMNVREDFASTLAHDLKTPLLGAIETLIAFHREQFGIVQSKQKPILETIIRSHQSSLKLVETLLDVYRNEMEGLVLNVAPVDLVEIATDVTASLLNLTTTRRVYLSLNYGASDFRKFLWVNGDAFQLRRVFTNLISNAINHSPRGAKVEVVLETQTTYQIVKVIDSGAGIKSEQIPYLFERFYQGKGDRQASGSGLGLYLTRQIIEAHGGTIWAENRLPHGAIFGFRLPVLIHYFQPHQSS